MRLPTYAKYKSSGVEWLGEVPARWEIKRLRHVLVRNDGGVWGDEDDPEGTIILRSTEQTLDGGWRIEEPARRVLSESEKRYYVLETGDLVVTKSSGSVLHIGKTSLVTKRVATLAACFSNFMQRLRMSRSVDPLLAFYLLNSPAGRQQLAFNSNTTTGLANLTGTALGNVFFPYSDSLREQRAISNFLAREIAKIDTLVAKKRTLIDRLKEKRTALISRTVTRGLPPDAARAAGLDPHPKLKPTGIDWLGEVPEHWDVKAIKWESPVLRGASPRPIDDDVYFDDEGEYAWVRITDVSAAGMYITATMQRLSDFGRSLSVPLQPGALFLSIAGTVGKPCITAIKCCIHDGFVYFPFWRGEARFLYYVFASREPYRGLGKLGTQLNLNTDTVGSIVVGFPEPSEQRAIADFLDRETVRLDTLVTKMESGIKRLHEYRAALITAAVTGKIDVRGTVVPEEDVA